MPGIFLYLQPNNLSSPLYPVPMPMHMPIVSSSYSTPMYVLGPTLSYILTRLSFSPPNILVIIVFKEIKEFFSNPILGSGRDGKQM